MIYAMGYNLLLGNSGLPSFGHGAFFGVGAYAFGLLQLEGVAQPVVRPRRRGRRRGRGRRRRGRVHLASPRHLLRVADDRVRPGVLVRRRQVALGHRRRGRPAQPQAAAGAARVRDVDRPASPTRRCSTSCSSRWCCVVLRLLALRAFAAWAACSVHQAERDARGLPGLPRVDLQVAGVRAVGGDRRAGRRAVRDGAAVGLSERDEPAPVGIRRDDGADRRRPRELLGPAASGAAFFILARDLLGAYTETWLFWYGLLFMADRAVEAGRAWPASAATSSRRCAPAKER